MVLLRSNSKFLILNLLCRKTILNFLLVEEKWPKYGAYNINELKSTRLSQRNKLLLDRLQLRYIISKQLPVIQLRERILSNVCCNKATVEMFGRLLTARCITVKTVKCYECSQKTNCIKILGFMMSPMAHIELALYI